MLNAGWGLTMRDCQSQSHLYGLLALYSVNGLHVDSCYINGYRNTERTIDDGNIAPGETTIRGRAGGMPEDAKYRKTGILTQYGHNITLNNVITEHWEIARFHINGAIADTGSWLEGNKQLGYALVNSEFDLRTPNVHAPAMIREGRFMRAGINVRGTISQSEPFPITQQLWHGDVDRIDEMGLSRKDFTFAFPEPDRFVAGSNHIAIQVADPDAAGWAHHDVGVTYSNRRPGHIRVAGDADDAIDNARLADTTHAVDLSTALQRIAASNHQRWTIELTEGARATLSSRFHLGGKRITFVGSGADPQPTIRVLPDDQGRLEYLRFANGGGVTLNGVTMRIAQQPVGLDPEHRAVIAIEGGRFRFAANDARLDLGGETNTAATLLRTRQASAIINVNLNQVRVEGGHALLEEDADLASVVDCRAVETTAPRALLQRARPSR